LEGGGNFDDFDDDDVSMTVVAVWRCGDDIVVDVDDLR